MYNFKKRNKHKTGYIYVNASDCSGMEYEHRVIAEETIGRKLLDDEEVHHLDNNKTNNSPDNLLVLRNTQHAKLHKWLDNNVVLPTPSYAIRKIKGCIRCKHCDKPILPTQVYCSRECVTAAGKENILMITDKNKLQEMLLNTPLTKIAKMLGLSDNGVRKRCISLGITIPKRK